jgi:hypothetical protein
LIYGAEDDPVSETRVEGLREGLHRLDWVEGHNLALDFRFGCRARLSADKVIHVVEPDHADQDQIDRDNIVQERRLQ